MRLALVSLHTSPAAVPGQGDAGGMNVVVFEAAHALAARGHEVVVATRATEGLAPGEALLEPQRSAARLVAVEAGEPGLDKRELPAILPEFSRGLRELGAFDAVHAHYWLSGVAALPLAAASGATPAVTLHTVAAQKNAALAPGDRPEPPLRLAAERALTRSGFVVAGSASERDAIVAGYGEPPRGGAVVHPGVDTRLFSPADPAEARAGRPLRLTVLGRVQPLKGQDLAVRAAAELARRDPELWARCELVVAGEPTPGAERYASELRSLAARLGVADQVRFLPAQDRAFAAHLLASSAVVLVPSHSETFGLVALEAAACGVPSVVGDHSGLVEAAPAGEAALHVPGRDPGDWAAALQRLLADDGARAALGRAARRHALAHDWAAHAAALEAVYARCARSA